MCVYKMCDVYLFFGHTRGVSLWSVKPLTPSPSSPSFTLLTSSAGKAVLTLPKGTQQDNPSFRTNKCLEILLLGKVAFGGSLREALVA